MPKCTVSERTPLIADALPTYTTEIPPPPPSLPPRPSCAESSWSTSSSAAQNNNHLNGSIKATTNKDQQPRFLARRCRTYLRQRPSTRQAAFLLLVCCLISNL